VTASSKKEKALYLGDDELRELITFADAVGILNSAFRDWAHGQAGNRPRQRLASGQSIFNVMAGSTSDGFVGLKAYTVSAEGAPMHVMLYAADGSGLVAILAGGWLSSVRTGAASGLSARYQAPAGTDAMAVIGTGGQAMAQVAGVVAATAVGTVKVYSRDEGRRESFARRVGAELGVSAEAVCSAERAVSGVGIVVTITNSAEHVLCSSDVSTGVHIIAAGNNNPGKVEIDPDLIARCATIVVDDVDQAMMECGELIRSYERGLVKRAQLVPLADVASGKAAGRSDADEITLFESQGIGLEDVAIAAHVYRAARKLGRGLALA
jgi:ornithine cyclodeaminase